MKKNAASMLRYKSLAHTLAPSYRALLFLLAAGMFLFSCKDEIELSSEASMTSLTLTIESTNYEITFKDRQGTITVPYSTELPGKATVNAVQLSAKATGVKAGGQVTISASGIITLTVTAEDKKTTQEYTVTVKKTTASSEAAITALTLTVGVTDYKVTFEDMRGRVTLPYGTSIPATVGVKNIALSLGATADAGDQLTVTNNTVTLTVTAEDGTTERVYTVTVRNAAPNSEAAITSLTLSVGDSDHEIDFTDRASTLIFSADFTLPTAVGVKKIDLSPGATSNAGDRLTVTNNTVTITVTAEDGRITQQYTVTLSLAANVGASITSLTLTVGDSDYEITFQGTRGTVIVPYETEIPAQVEVKKIALSDGATSDAGNERTVTDNAVTITVTAEDGETESAYTVTFSVAGNSEASITTLTLTVGDTDYEVTFEDVQGAVIVPYSTEIPTDAVVKAVKLSAGATGIMDDDQLSITNNAVTLTVTAEDGKTTQEYTVTVRNAAPSSEAAITDLTFTVGDTDYEVTFEDMQGRVTLPYSTSIPATVGVKKIDLSPGATSNAGDRLTVTNNTVTLTVTAEDGKTTQEYTVTVRNAAPRSEADITDLTLTVGDTDYKVTFMDRQDTLRIGPLGTPVPATVGVKKIDLSPGATSVDQGTQLTVTNKAVTFTVTAEDGMAKNTYTVVLGFTTVGITTFTFEVIDNERMALDEDDRKQIVARINQQDKTLTFDEQSAYMYRDKLIATYALSELGATVQVKGVTQEPGVTEQDFTSPVIYVVSSEEGTETTTYTVTLPGSTMATIEGDNFRAKLKTLFPAAFTGDRLDITHKDVINYNIMEIGSSSIASLKGIEFFRALHSLNCDSNDLPSLDVSRNTALTKLYCGNNDLTSLDVSRNTALNTLNCHENALTSLDVSRNTALTSLYCYMNSLTSLDMTGMRNGGDLTIGKGTAKDNPLLATLRVNTALQDHAAIITMKGGRGEDLTITTVNNQGKVVCNDYIPAENGGNCQQAP